MTHQDYIARLIEKAGESIEVARSVSADGHHEFAASRAYYAMFYAAEAALLSRNLSFSKHSAVIANFNRTFVKTGVFGPEMSKALQLGFDLRQQGDYTILPVSEERITGLLARADSFVASVTEFLAGDA